MGMNRHENPSYQEGQLKGAGNNRIGVMINH